MGTFRSRLSRRDAEQILDHRGDPSDPLAALVDAAAGVRRAAPAPVRARRLAALPAAGLVAGALVLGGGGIALAATHGALNVPFTGHDNRSEHAPAAPSSTNPGLSHTPGHSASHAPGTPKATHTPSSSPSPSLEGLCHAFQAGADPQKATNPAFSALRAAAGGADNVSSYCTHLIGAPTKPTQPAHPTQAATPTHKPSPTHPA